MIYNRPDEQVFASTAKSGEVVNFPDILRGWGLTFDETGGIPPMEWFNALGLRTDQAIQYFLQNGIAEWDTETDYPIGGYAKHASKVWRAKKRNSGNEPSAQNDNWEQAALTLGEVKALIPSLMTQEELDEGLSTTPKTVNAALLKTILDKVNTDFATNAEAQTGTIANKVISPASLASVTSTTERRGLIQIATNEEVANGSNTTKAVTASSLSKTLSDRFTIIYPAGGSEARPANVTTATRYVMDNPFSGYPIFCVAEIYYNNIWVDPSYYMETNSRGTKATHIIESDKIIIQTGGSGVVGFSGYSGGGHGTTSTGVASAPCRIRVWRIA